MKRLKVIATVTAVLSGLALASCTDDSLNTRTSFTASPSAGSVDLSSVPGYATSIGGFTIALSNNNTVATITCPPGEVSFDTSRQVTCKNSGGCSIQVANVEYTNPLDTDSDQWDVETDPVPQNMSIPFSLNNFSTGTSPDTYETALACIPQNQVGYWS